MSPGVLRALPLVATSITVSVASSALEVSCRRARDVVTARVGLKATETVQVASGAIGALVQVCPVTAKSEAAAASGASAWTATELMVSGASPRLRTVTVCGALLLPPGWPAGKAGGRALMTGAGAPLRVAKLIAPSRKGALGGVGPPPRVVASGGGRPGGGGWGRRRG